MTLLFELFMIHVVSFSKVIIIVIEFVERILFILSFHFFCRKKCKFSFLFLEIDSSFDKHQENSVSVKRFLEVFNGRWCGWRADECVTIDEGQCYVKTVDCVIGCWLVEPLHHRTCDRIDEPYNCLIFSYQDQKAFLLWSRVFLTEI